jgi:hypothetical protein|tara:strand:- start:1338 stop:2213 length:876 start_codon:yes stop_codon:yes gene_type:complete
LVDRVLKRGFESVFGRYYGIYRGQVVDVDDPEDRMRIRALCPDVGWRTEEQVPRNIWALPNAPGLGACEDGDQGVFLPPKIGSPVWLSFEAGRPRNPVYSGGWLQPSHGATRMVGEDSPRGLRTTYGHHVRMTDDGVLTIGRGDGEGDPAGSYVSMMPDGAVVIASENESIVYLDKDGNVSVVAKDGNTLSVGNGEAKLIGEDGSFLMLKGGALAVRATSVTFEAGSIALRGAVVAGPKGSEKPVLTAVAALHTHPVPGAVPVVPGVPVITGPPVPPIVPGNGQSIWVKLG